MTFQVHLPHYSFLPLKKASQLFSFYRNGQLCQSDAYMSPNPMVHPGLQLGSPSQHQFHGKSCIEEKNNCLFAVTTTWTHYYSSITKSQIKNRRIFRSKGKFVSNE